MIGCCVVDQFTVNLLHLNQSIKAALSPAIWATDLWDDCWNCIYMMCIMLFCHSSSIAMLLVETGPSCCNIYFIACKRWNMLNSALCHSSVVIAMLNKAFEIRQLHLNMTKNTRNIPYKLNAVLDTSFSMLMTVLLRMKIISLECYPITFESNWWLFQDASMVENDGSGLVIEQSTHFQKHHTFRTLNSQFCGVLPSKVL